MSAGPMAPPPLPWHPEQLYAPNRRLPSDSACAFSSYGVFAGGGGDPPPGCRSLTATAYVVDPGGISRNCRVSRLHEGRKKIARIAPAIRISRPMAHPWNVILVEQTLDIGTTPIEHGVDLVAQWPRAARHA